MITHPFTGREDTNKVVQCIVHYGYTVKVPHILDQVVVTIE